MTDGEKFKSPTFCVVTSNAPELDNAQRKSVTEGKRSWEASLVGQKRKREENCNSNNFSRDVLRNSPFSITPKDGERSPSTNVNAKICTTSEISSMRKATMLFSDLYSFPNELRKISEETHAAKSNLTLEGLPKKADVRQVMKGEVDKVTGEKKIVQKKAKRIILGSHLNRMTLTPKARKIFDAALEVKKKLYSREKAVKRYRFNNDAFFKNVKITYNQCIHVTYKNVETNSDVENYRVTLILDN